MKFFLSIFKIYFLSNVHFQTFEFHTTVESRKSEFVAWQLNKIYTDVFERCSLFHPPLIFFGTIDPIKFAITWLQPI